MLYEVITYTNSYSQVFLLIGILLLIGGTLLLFILNGYILKMIRLSLEKSPELPEWNNYSELFKSGFVFTIGISIIAFRVVTVVEVADPVEVGAAALSYNFV